MELMHTVLITRGYYVATIVNFGSLRSLDEFPIEFKISIICANLVACIVQVS